MALHDLNKYRNWIYTESLTLLDRDIFDRVLIVSEHPSSSDIHLKCC